ncbi:MAG: class I SAM-dependent methyltransferase [Alphaproteobacteria bacterium]|nr:class I SAM-dependent methyltransferase [Alphaproteobacteria bacterium]
MKDVFGSTYADAYDSLYASKDYAAECRLIEQLATEHGLTGPGRLIDFGCGTGSHAIILAQSGWSVSGIDLSREMLSQAAGKAKALQVEIDLHEGDVKCACAGTDFDLAVMMFAVLGYQKSNADVLAALRNVRNHLRPDGLFVFDVWHGPAVLSEKPGERLKRISFEGGEMLRAAKGSLDVRRHLCAVDYDLWIFNGNQLARRTSERHEMRFFFPLEIEFFLSQSGFRILRLASFDEPTLEPTLTDWNMFVVAQAA